MSDDIMFEVQLIKAPKFSRLTGIQAADLIYNCRHIAGQYWFFEGEAEALRTKVKVIETATSCSVGDMDDDDFLNHCAHTFGFDFDGMSPMYLITLHEEYET